MSYICDKEDDYKISDYIKFGKAFLSLIRNNCNSLVVDKVNGKIENGIDINDMLLSYYIIECYRESSLVYDGDCEYNKDIAKTIIKSLIDSIILNQEEMESGPIMGDSEFENYKLKVKELCNILLFGLKKENVYVKLENEQAD